MREILGIEERKLHNMRRDTVKCYLACIGGGFLAAAVAIAILLIYCRMEGPLI